MLALIALGAYGIWRLEEWSRGPEAAKEVQAWFDARADAVTVESCAHQKLDSVFDLYSCALRTDDADVLAWYGVTGQSGVVKVCFSVPRAARPAGYRSDHDPRRENERGSSGDCLGRT